MRLERVTGSELMDRSDVARDELAESLADLRRVNRWLGGLHAALAAVMPVIRNVEDAEVRVLDVGTGSADIPLAVVRRARRAGLVVRSLATDVHPGTVAAALRATAGEPAVDVYRADGLALPFRPEEFHIAMCHTVLHHFDESEATRLLGELGRVASRAVVVTDLARSRTAVAGVRSLSATLWRSHPVTRHDSVVSIRAAYTPDEAEALARAAGLRNPRIRRHPFFRFSLVAEPPGSRQ